MGAPHMMLNNKTEAPQNPLSVFLGLHQAVKAQKGSRGGGIAQGQSGTLGKYLLPL